MKPVRLDLEMWTDGAFDEVVEVTVNGAPQEFTDWEFKSIAAASVSATEPLFELAVTPKGAGILGLHVDVEALSALFSAGDTATQKRVLWVLKARPGVSYPVRLFYGSITVSKGLPPWL